MNKHSIEFKKLLNKKIIGIGERTIYLEDGLCIDFHPYETYIETYDKSILNPKEIQYYSPKLFN